MSTTLKKQFIFGIIFLLVSYFNRLEITKASSAEEKGRSIAEIVDQANRGFIGEEAKMQMILLTSANQKVIRELEGKTRENFQEKTNQSISIFHLPKDVRGTVLLTWEHKDRDNEQWLYLPSLKRVKRITSSVKNSSFLGSEFSYEDIGGRPIEKFNYQFLAEESCPVDKDLQDLKITLVKPCWKIERTSKEKSGYKRQVMWIAQDFKNAIRVEYYDKKNELLKTAYFDSFVEEKVKNKVFFKARRIRMKNIQTQKESQFIWLERKLGVEIKKSDLTPERLQK